MTLADAPRPFAPPDPGANALKTGTLADLPRVPEDAAAINARTLDWYPALKPQNHFECWVVEQVSVHTVKIEHIARTERRMRDRNALRAGIFWDDDRRQEAILLGDRLARSPQATALQLRRTPQGCDWMIERWARLARIADVKKSWDEAQQTLAFDLLGTRPDDRDRPIGESIDREGRVVENNDDLAALARREIAGLMMRKEEVAGADALERALSRSDYLDEPSREIKQLHRREAELHRRLRWYLTRIDNDETYTNPRMDDYFLPLAETVPPLEPEVTDEANVVVSEAEAEAEFEPAPDFPPVLSARREERSKKVEARRESRRKKLDRRRA